MAASFGQTLAARKAALHEARRELANIAAAILQGILTPTRAMPGESEQRIARLKDAVRELRRRPALVASLESSIERYLDDLRGMLKTDVGEARRLLSLGLGRIVLRRDGTGTCGPRCAGP